MITRSYRQEWCGQVAGVYAAQLVMPEHLVLLVQEVCILQYLKKTLLNAKAATNKPFAVNLPILYSDIENHLKIIFRNKIEIVITSAGNPATYTPILKDHGIKVIHVVSSKRFAEKAEKAGCDAVIAEGFEAGGHNGREETTSMVLIPLVSSAVSIPVIAAGGIATGRQMLAAMVLGAEGVQIGSRFVASKEASSHNNFKNAVIQFFRRRHCFNFERTGACKDNEK